MNNIHDIPKALCSQGEKIRLDCHIAIVGYGYIGAIHAEYIRSCGFMNLTGIVDIAETRRQYAASQGIHAYHSFEEMLGDTRVEIVLITTPNHLHCPQTIQCLNAGKHVIREKPIALSVPELQRMFDAAQANGRLLTAHMNRRWDADFLGVMQVLRSGMLGALYDIESRVHGSRGIPAGWRREKACGGGMLYDWGPHLVDQILLANPAARVEKVFCSFDRRSTFEVDDGFHLSMFFGNGVRAFAEAATCNFLPLPRFYLRGNDGTALFQDWQHPCRVAKLRPGERTETNPAGMTRLMAPRDEKELRVEAMELPKTEKGLFFQNFCSAVRGDAELAVTQEQLLKLTKVLDAAFLSGSRGEAAEIYE